jgi:hypothetical protein
MIHNDLRYTEPPEQSGTLFSMPSHQALTVAAVVHAVALPVMRSTKRSYNI